MPALMNPAHTLALTLAPKISEEIKIMSKSKSLACCSWYANPTLSGRPFVSMLLLGSCWDVTGLAKREENQFAFKERDSDRFYALG